MRNLIPAGTPILMTRVAEENASTPEAVSGAFALLHEHRLAVRSAPDRVTVLPISEGQLRDACFLREQAEVEIVRIVAGNADSDFLGELREQIQRQKVVGLRSPRDLLRLDDRFHLTLAERAGFGSIWPQLESWKLCTDRVRHTVEESLDPELMISQHSAIVDRIAMGDAEGAAAAMRYHVCGVLRQVPEYRLSHKALLAD
ncbi:GntR family transcriptional regulator [Salipiger sp. H15]|uniref:GntR family transcriptional regulator n=1 Tax=Alloyangia sp. H15 TaxID=3029062 RepID=A0AAU8AHZ9_9RHOB